MRNKGIIRQWLESENYSDIIKSYGVVNESLSNQIIGLLFTKYNNNTINNMIESFLSGLVRIEYCSNIREEVFDNFLVEVLKKLENNNYHNYNVLYDLATDHFYELFNIYKVKYYVNEQKYLEDNFNKYMKTYNYMKIYNTKKILLQEIYAYVEKFF